MNKLSAVGLLTILSVLLPLSSHAQVGAKKRVITVTATHQVHPPADRARLSLAVERTAKTAGDAARQVAEASQRVIRALRQHTGAGDRVVGKRYTLDPQYLPRQPRASVAKEPEIVGYRAYNEVQLTTADLDGVGAFIDAAVEAGANRIAGLAFEVADPSPYQREALEAAAKKAALKAEAIAKALGVILGPVAEATSEPGQISFPRPVLASSLARAAARTPVLPGSVSVQGTVRVSYEITP